MMETHLVTLLAVEWRGYSEFAAGSSPAALEARVRAFAAEASGLAAGHGGSPVVNMVKGSDEVRLFSFPGPSAALRAAAELAPGLVAKGFPVALAVHAGECFQRGETLLGPPLREIADLLPQAGTGEILLTDVVRLTATREEVPPMERLDRVVELGGEPHAVHRLGGVG